MYSVFRQGKYQLLPLPGTEERSFKLPTWISPRADKNPINNPAVL